MRKAYNWIARRIGDLAIIVRLMFLITCASPTDYRNAKC
jgi:hypothetical protein